jgi:hypothetical protein
VKIDQRFSAHNRIRFLTFNRNHDRGRKLFRKNQQSVFIAQSDPDFPGKIDP